MILGTGIDLLKISRVEKVLNKYGNIFIKKILSTFKTSIYYHNLNNGQM